MTMPMSSRPSLAGIFLLAIAAVPAVAGAQGAQAPASTDFQINGSATVGYRSTDVTGREEKYKELVNLDDGLRLLDANVFGRAPQGADRFADTFSASASGIGGDPFSAVQVTLRKSRMYDFRATWRRSKYFWDQDDTTLPSGKNGLTDNHSWDTTRDMASVNLLVHVSNSLRAGLDISHMNRDGMTVTTRSPDFFGSPSAWGSFARANPYLIDAPLTEAVNRYAGTLDFTRAKWAFHYNGGYQTFDDSVLAEASNSPERSINIDDTLTAQELLQHGSYQDFRRLNTPLSEFTYDGEVTPQIKWRGGYTYYRYSGPAGIEAAYNGSARNNNIPTPYTLSFDTRADVREPTHVLTQGITWTANDHLSVLADYHFTNVAIDTTAEFHSLLGSTTATGDVHNQWAEHRHQLDTDVEVVPAKNLFVRGGIRWLHNDVQVQEDGVVDPVRTKTIGTFWPTVSASYTPSNKISIHGDFDAINNDTSYTSITPHLDVGSRLQVRVRPTDQLSIEESLQIRNRSLDATNYTDHVRANALNATWTFNERLAAFGGYSYQSLVSSGTTTFVRGTPPLDVTIDDQERDHVWHYGVSVKSAVGLGADVAGNYLRTTGQGVITGEPPQYGPLTYPYYTISLYYQVRQAGRLSVDFQRVSYTEEIVPDNNFRAHLIMVRWTKDF